MSCVTNDKLFIKLLVLKLVNKYLLKKLKIKNLDKFIVKY